mmetsp:Transcript_119100/g.332304  ORF Transcript_119100/g.332304 Transcript_119100/m.332304 type:complete len:277 (+) Transcript_119100:987-1817(+)
MRGAAALGSGSVAHGGRSVFAASHNGKVSNTLSEKACATDEPAAAAAGGAPRGSGPGRTRSPLGTAGTAGACAARTGAVAKSGGSLSGESHGQVSKTPSEGASLCNSSPGLGGPLSPDGTAGAGVAGAGVAINRGSSASKASRNGQVSNTPSVGACVAGDLAEVAAGCSGPVSPLSAAGGANTGGRSACRASQSGQVSKMPSEGASSAASDPTAAAAATGCVPRCSNLGPPPPPAAGGCTASLGTTGAGPGASGSSSDSKFSQNDQVSKMPSEGAS